MNAEKRTRRQRHNNFCVGGMPPLLRKSNASAVMGFILLCVVCMSNDARCPPYLPPFTTSPFPISGRWGTVPLNLLLRLLRYCYAEYHNTRTVVTASPRVIILSPFFIISFRFNHYITVFSNLLSSAL